MLAVPVSYTIFGTLPVRDPRRYAGSKLATPCHLVAQGTVLAKKLRGGFYWGGSPPLPSPGSAGAPRPRTRHSPMQPTSGHTGRVWRQPKPTRPRSRRRSSWFAGAGSRRHGPRAVRAVISNLAREFPPAAAPSDVGFPGTSNGSLQDVLAMGPVQNLAEVRRTRSVRCSPLKFRFSLPGRLPAAATVRQKIRDFGRGLGLSIRTALPIAGCTAATLTKRFNNSRSDTNPSSADFSGRGRFVSSESARHTCTHPPWPAIPAKVTR